MRANIKLLVGALFVAAAACGGEISGPGDGSGTGSGSGSGSGDEWDQKLADRQVDYNAALRIAALRLTGELPTLAEIKSVQNAGDLTAQKTVYEALVKGYMDSPKFARQMVSFWRDTLKLGGTQSYDQAAYFAAQVTVENRPYTQLLTAQNGTCPSYDPNAGTFTAGDCSNGVATAAGLLSHPGVMQQFYSNMAFRRVRWVQEVFDCARFPIEVGPGVQVNGAIYTSPWPFASVAAPSNGGTIDFQDTKAVVCANCHTTMNHMAPLFANFDENGQMTGAIAVHTPADGSPLAKISDWLPAGEVPAWRFGVPVSDLPSLGAAMAADHDVQTCAIARVWNFALGKGDIVDTLAVVPPDVIKAQVDAFTANGMKMKDALYAVFTSDDFVKF
jgi:Protein of unknown function (DUF1549)